MHQEAGPAPVLEQAAQAFVDAHACPPLPPRLDAEAARQAMVRIQDPPVPDEDVAEEWLALPHDAADRVRVRIVRPAASEGDLPVILYLHGLGWVLGDARTHDRLVRTLALGVDAAVVFPEYDRSPEARYPTAIEQNYAVARWITAHGEEAGLDGSRIAVVGDSVGATMAAALTLMAKERGDVRLLHQVLICPVTDTDFDTASYRQFADGYFLGRETMRWFWDQYTTDPVQRAEITASPLRATLDQLAGLPPALVLVGEADVVRDEGEAYAAKLRAAGVPVASVRYHGAIHDFVVLDALQDTQAAQAALVQTMDTLHVALHSRRH